MAEEDVIFGKSKHLFGGIEPSNMLVFTLTAKRDVSAGTPYVFINAELPSDTVINGQTICTVAGAVIRKSTEGYPETEFDGELVADVKENGEYTDTNVEYGKTYYYSAFPYSDQDVYLRNDSNRVSMSFEGTLPTYIFGYDLDTNEPDPEARVTYPSDADNYTYESFSSDSYGDWPITPGIGFIPKPCMLKYDGTVYEYLDPDDYTKNINGEGSKVADMSFEGNAMMEWPKIYTKRWEDENGIYHFRCSDAKLDDSWDCWCNYDVNDNEIDHFYTSIYRGSNDGSRLRSISGASIYSYTETDAHETINNYRSKALQNGSDWHISELGDWLLIQDLLVMMAKSTDKNNYINNNYPKVFGMENWFGNLIFIAGLIVCASDNTKDPAKKWAYRYKITRGKHDGSSRNSYDAAKQYGTTGNGYKILLSDVSYTTIWNFTGGYITKLLTTDYGRMLYGTGYPNAYAGSSTTYECDTYSQSIGTQYGITAYFVSSGLFGGQLVSRLSHIYPTACLSCKPSAN